MRFYGRGYNNSVRIVPPYSDDVRTVIVNVFLWFPKEIGRETRWLERAVIEQRILAYTFVSSDGKRVQVRKWIDKYWRN